MVSVCEKTEERKSSHFYGLTLHSPAQKGLTVPIYKFLFVQTEKTEYRKLWVSRIVTEKIGTALITIDRKTV